MAWDVCGAKSASHGSALAEAQGGAVRSWAVRAQLVREILLNMRPVMTSALVKLGAGDGLLAYGPAAYSSVTEVGALSLIKHRHKYRPWV